MRMDIRRKTDSLSEVAVPADKLWGAQTQRSLENFIIGKDLIPRVIIIAYATLKKEAANANHAGGRLDDRTHGQIVQVGDEILSGQHHDHHRCQWIKEGLSLLPRLKMLAVAIISFRNVPTKVKFIYG